MNSDPGWCVYRSMQLKRTFPRYLVLAAALLLGACNHHSMVEMQKSLARERYYEHGDRQAYEQELKEIDAQSEAWELDQKRKKAVELP